MSPSSERLIGVVRDLVREVHPGTDTRRVTLDSALDRDLGLDSLARVELMVRVEKAFDIALAEQILNGIETPRDLLRELSKTGGRRNPLPLRRGEKASPAVSDAVPRHAQTLVDVLEWYGTLHPDRPHIRLYDDNSEGEVITYGDLWRDARHVAAGLVRLGLRPGESALIMLPTGREYFQSFFGVLLAGGVPAPVYPPGHIRQIEEHLRRHVAIAENALAAVMITIPEASRYANLSLASLPAMRRVTTVEELTQAGGYGAATHSPAPGDTAFLQYTSGSTGTPKGVVLSHANLLANIRSMGTAIRVTSSDVFVSWLPLYHDMGLIGAWLGSLYSGCHLVIMSPLSFIARPQRWLWAIHRYRATLSAAPNFAYELCLRRIEAEDLDGLDLASWRCAFNGAEGVSPRTVSRFVERFAPYGFRPETMMPVFGLAENAVGLTFPPLGRPPLVDVVQRDDFTRKGIAIPAGNSDEPTLSFIACGRPLPGHEIRVADTAGRELPDRHEGRLQFRGPSSTSGYFRNAGETRDLFQGEWLNTGDLAYIAAGDVYVTGRTKDVVIRAGRNIHPAELEEAAGKVEGIREGCVAAFGTNDPVTGTERLVILAETRKRDPEERKQVQRRIVEVVTGVSGLPPDEVVLAPPNTVLKTSSGKIRRSASRRIYERGEIGKPPRALWVQLGRVSLAALLHRMRRLLRRVSGGMYAAYCWTTFLLVGFVSWMFIVVLPAAPWRWWIVRRGIRLLTSLLRIPIVVEGADNTPPAETPCIVVSNHASYLDGFVLAAALPRPVRFVAKGELRGNFFARTLLERVGAQFVDRFDTGKGVQDAQRLVEGARAGHPLMFFPEGTVTRMPGLLPFRMGAFETAARGNLPVLPVVIRGTRSILRPESWFPRRGLVRIIIGTPMDPRWGPNAGTDTWATAVALRDETREWILHHCGEPDLGHERASVFAFPANID